MKRISPVLTGVLISLLFFVPVPADAHGGGAILGFGLGLLAGLAFAPGPVYVGAPVYYAPPPPAVYVPYPYSYYVPAPNPPPVSYGYSGIATVAPAGQARCREWRLINRDWENRWDPYYGKWRAVLVEKWGWAAVPCNH